MALTSILHLILCEIGASKQNGHFPYSANSQFAFLLTWAPKCQCRCVGECWHPVGHGLAVAACRWGPRQRSGVLVLLWKMRPQFQEYTWHVDALWDSHGAFPIISVKVLSGHWVTLLISFGGSSVRSLFQSCPRLRTLNSYSVLRVAVD